MADGEGRWDIYGEAMGNAAGGSGDWVLLDSFIRFLEGLNRIRRRHRSDRIIRVRPTNLPYLLRCWKTLLFSHPQFALYCPAELQKDKKTCFTMCLDFYSLM